MAELLSKSTRGGGFKMALLIDLPERPAQIAQDRVWNKINKDAMKVALMHHHNTHMPRHFKRDARQRYSHKERNAKYKAWKKRKFGSLIDLVMSGSTRDKITKAGGYDRITIGGAAVGGQKDLVGKLVYTFGFNDKLKAFYLSKKVRFHNDPVTRDPREQWRRRQKAVARTIGPRVSLQDMRAELMKMTPDEVKIIAEVFRKEVFRLIEALPQRRRKVRTKSTGAARVA